MGSMAFLPWFCTTELCVVICVFYFFVKVVWWFANMGGDA